MQPRLFTECVEFLRVQLALYCQLKRSKRAVFDPGPSARLSIPDVLLLALSALRRPVEGIQFFLLSVQPFILKVHSPYIFANVFFRLLGPSIDATRVVKYSVTSL